MDSKTTINPSACLCWIFASEVLVLAAIYFGLLEGDTYLLYGLLMLGVSPGYFVGSKMLAADGQDYLANLWLLFGCLFGTIFGLCYIAYFFAGVNGWDLNGTILGIPTFLSGVFLIFSMVPSRFYTSKVEFLLWTITAIWLMTLGLEYFIGGDLLYQFNAVCAIVVGVGASYVGIHELLKTCGSGLPVGKPFFKQ
jgi:hypothetical protein